jgi:hypothetical protein
MKPIFVILGALLMVAGLYVAGSGLPLSVTGNTLVVVVTAGGTPVNGASIRVTTPEGTLMTGRTGGSGSCQFTGLDQGLYTVSISTTNFGSATRRANVGASTLITITVDLVTAPPQDNPETFTPTKLSGIVYSQKTNTPLANAKVVAASLSATTDANGAYLLTFTAAWSGKVFATFDGYKSVEKQMTISEGLTIREDFQVQNGWAESVVIKAVRDADSTVINDRELSITLGSTTKKTNTGQVTFTNINYGPTWMITIGGDHVSFYRTYVAIDSPSESFIFKVAASALPVEEVDPPISKYECDVAVSGVGVPVANARITLTGPQTYVFETDENGHASGEIDIGAYSVSIVADGFDPVGGSTFTATDGGTETQSYELESKIFDDEDGDVEYPDDEATAALTFSDYFASIALIITGLIVLLYGVRRT